MIEEIKFDLNIQVWEFKQPTTELDLALFITMTKK